MLFSQLPDRIDNALHQEQSLLAVELSLAQGDFSRAQRMLSKISPSGLKRGQRVRFWQSTVMAEQGKPSPIMLRALITLSPLLTTPQERQNNSEAVRATLTAMSQAQVYPLPPENEGGELRGWQALRRVWSDNREAADRMVQDVSVWLARWPQHPATKMRPLASMDATGDGTLQGDKIAMLLPLSGPAAKFGRAIRKGFEAAARANTTSSAQLPGRILYDTTTTPVEALLSMAQQDGAALVVGPLLKNDVDTLLRSTTTLNVLALNLPENPVHRGNICYFALSPENEARSAARHIHGQGKHSPLLLLPPGAFGVRVAGALTAEWQKLDGGAVLAQRFRDVFGLKAGVNGGVGMSLTGTPVITDRQQQRRVTGVTALNSGAGERRPGQVDAVYVIATPTEMGYLKAMLTMRNGSAVGAMLYASSRSISSNGGADYRLEMEGLQFSDIPLLSVTLPEKKQVLNVTRNDYFSGAPVRDGSGCLDAGKSLLINTSGPEICAPWQYR